MVTEMLPMWAIPSQRPYIFHLVMIHALIGEKRYWDRYPANDGSIPLQGLYTGPLNILEDRGIRHYQAFRMDVNQLEAIVSLFNKYEGHYVSPTKPQAPPKYQIACLIYRLAHAHGVRQIARTFGVSSEF
jgi:hypothetical protein